MSRAQQRQQAVHAAAHELATHAKDQAGKLALLGLACAIGGLFFPPLELVAAVALEVSEAYLVAGVGIDLAVAVDHLTQDNWVPVGGDVVALARRFGPAHKTSVAVAVALFSRRVAAGARTTAAKARWTAAKWPTASL